MSEFPELPSPMCGSSDVLPSCWDVLRCQVTDNGPAAAHLRPVGGDMKSCEFSSEHVGQGIDSLTLSLTESLSLPHLCLHQ